MNADGRENGLFTIKRTARSDPPSYSRLAQYQGNQRTVLSPFLVRRDHSGGFDGDQLCRCKHLKRYANTHEVRTRRTKAFGHRF